MKNDNLISTHINMLQFITIILSAHFCILRYLGHLHDATVHKYVDELTMTILLTCPWVLFLTFSFTWQDSTCSLSRRYSRRHWQQPSDSWEISGMFYKWRALLGTSYCKHSSATLLEKDTANFLKEVSWAGRFVICCRLHKCRHLKKQKKVEDGKKPALTYSQHTAFSSNISHEV